MALKISSYYLNQGRDDARISGLIPNAATQALGIFGGMVITQDNAGVPTGDGRTFKFFSGTSVISATNPFALGLVIEPTPGNFRVASGDSASGQGYDTSNYAAFGDIYSAVHTPGMIVDVYDDLRDVTPCTMANATIQNKSCPFYAGLAWAIGDIIYATAAGIDTTNATRCGLLTNVEGPASAGALRVGFLRAVNTDDAGATVLSIELNMGITYA